MTRVNFKGHKILLTRNIERGLNLSVFWALWSYYSEREKHQKGVGSTVREIRIYRRSDKVFPEYSDVQKIAKETIEYVKTEIRPGMSLPEVRTLCEERMTLLGADSFWYWDIGAFIFVGDETTISVSGKDYTTSDRVIGSDDIVTIDLSPQIGDTWGDYARTIIIEKNNVVKSVSEIINDEWRDGLLMEKNLYDKLNEIADPQMTFEDLYFGINKFIKDMGYINLDFMGNLGHSIVRRKDDRVYIEKGNRIKLGDVSYFTFEPHISANGSKYGFKREDIYYYDNDVLKVL